MGGNGHFKRNHSTGNDGGLKGRKFPTSVFLCILHGAGKNRTFMKAGLLAPAAV